MSNRRKGFIQRVENYFGTDRAAPEQAEAERAQRREQREAVEQAEADEHQRRAANLPSGSKAYQKRPH